MDYSSGPGIADVIQRKIYDGVRTKRTPLHNRPRELTYES